MILASLVFIALLAVIVSALRLNMAIVSAHERFRVLLGGYGDADLLAGARRRFRERQQRVEAVVDSGAVGLEAAHRGLSRLVTGRRNGRPAFYEQVRIFNRGLGKTITGMFAPKPRRRSESLAEWRAREQADSDDGSDRDDTGA